MAGLGSGMYPSSYPSSEQNPYPSISMENSAFYGSLVSQTHSNVFNNHSLRLVVKPNETQPAFIVVSNLSFVH